MANYDTELAPAFSSSCIQHCPSSYLLQGLQRRSCIMSFCRREKYIWNNLLKSNIWNVWGKCWNLRWTKCTATASVFLRLESDIYIYIFIFFFSPRHRRHFAELFPPPNPLLLWWLPASSRLPQNREEWTQEGKGTFFQICLHYNG